MKVVALMGSPRRGQTDRAVRIFEKHLRSLGVIEFEYIYLKDHEIQPCRGCALCLERGEEYCPLKDDRQMLFEAMAEANGVIFATPNFSLHVTGILKDFLDRLCFVFHRPCFFHKSSIAIVTQGVYGGNDIIKYLSTVAEFWGFNPCPGVVLTTPWGVSNPREDWPEPERTKIDSALRKAADNFFFSLSGKNPEPSLKKLLIYRFTRTYHKFSAARGRDYNYFKEQGWFEKPYFYDTRIGFLKRILGALADKWQENQVQKSKGGAN